MSTTTQSLRKFGSSVFEDILNNPADYLPELKKLESVFNSLEIGQYDNQVLTDMLKDGVENFLTKYKDQVMLEIEGSGIKTACMKAILMQGYESAAAELREAYKDLINTEPSTTY